MDELTEEEKRALRGSKFAPLPTASHTSRPQPRQAHPGGPLKTNKAAALAKFLERKLQQADGLADVDPRLVEMAVKNAKETVSASGTSSSERTVIHVESFGDLEDVSGGDDAMVCVPKKQRKKKKKKNKKKKLERRKNEKLKDLEDATIKRPQKKLKR